MDAAHRRAPQASLWTFVDDAVGRSEGIPETVVSDMQGLADAFSEGFRTKRLTVSDKTVVLASSPDLGKR
eukprot:2110710-Pyramimonas_sp.AAC.1